MNQEKVQVLFQLSVSKIRKKASSKISLITQTCFFWEWRMNILIKQRLEMFQIRKLCLFHWNFKIQDNFDLTVMGFTNCLSIIFNRSWAIFSRIDNHDPLSRTDPSFPRNSAPPDILPLHPFSNQFRLAVCRLSCLQHSLASNHSSLSFRCIALSLVHSPTLFCDILSNFSVWIVNENDLVRMGQGIFDANALLRPKIAIWIKISIERRKMFGFKAVFQKFLIFSGFKLFVNKWFEIFTPIRQRWYFMVMVKK